MELFCGTSRFTPSAVSRKLVRLIETGAEDMARSYTREIRSVIEAPGFRTFDEREVHDRGFRVFSQFGRWISNEVSEKDIEEYWTALGPAAPPGRFLGVRDHDRHLPDPARHLL